MNYTIIAVSLICFSLPCILPSFPQNLSWHLTSNEGVVLSQIELDELEDDYLTIFDTTGRVRIPIESIAKLRYERKGSFWKGMEKGALYGGVFGMVAGAIAGANVKGSDLVIIPDTPSLRLTAAFLGALVYGILGALLGGIFGGVITSLSSVDDVYDLSEMPLRGKQTVIISILKKYKE
jgi:hypothetical protein